MGGTCRLRSGWLDVRHRDQFRQLPEVLGGGCQEEFIAGTMFRIFANAFSEAKEWVRNTSAEEIAAKEAPFFPGIDEAVLASAIAQYKSIGVWNGGIEIPRDLYEQSLTVFESTGAIKKRHP